MNFTKAIVRTPSPSLIKGLSSVDLGLPVYEKAIRQHRKYVQTLKRLGLEVTELEPADQFPDATFVEDVALLTPHCAIITKPGAPSRKDETKLIDPVLKSFFEQVEYISEPGTLDAGDVIEIEGEYFIGISERTSAKGAQQLILILHKYGLQGYTVPVQDGLHLKSSISYLGRNTLLATADFSDHPVFQKYDIIEVCEEESYAANSLLINGKVIVPKGFYHTIDQLEHAGFDVEEVAVTEFEKVDGGLSCLSLRF